MKKTGGLGRGMNALMGDDFSVSLKTQTEIDKEYIHQLPISAIDINKSQPRKSFNKETIEYYYKVFNEIKNQ